MEKKGIHVVTYFPPVYCDDKTRKDLEAFVERTLGVKLNEHIQSKQRKDGKDVNQTSSRKTIVDAIAEG